MNKILKNKRGFTVIEALLIILVIAVVGFGGYYVWHTQHTSKTSTTTAATKPSTETTTATPNPYAGWETATLQYEKITYKYPSDWTVTNYSGGPGCVTPGSDYIYLTSPSNEQVELRTGVSCIGDAGAVDYGTAIPISSLGQNLYIVFENWAGDVSPGPTYPQFACLAMTSSPNTPLDFVSRNILINDTTISNRTTNDSFCYYPYNQSAANTTNTSPPVESVSSIENSPDFTTAKLIFESMHY